LHGKPPAPAIAEISQRAEEHGSRAQCFEVDQKYWRLKRNTYVLFVPVTELIFVILVFDLCFIMA
jgi:hypothetical protein